MTHAYSDVLLVGGRPNQWVKYVNNDGNAAHVYVSTAVTTFQSATTGAGVYTFNPSPIGGIYTSYLIDGSLSATAPAAGDVRWAPSGITSHVVSYTVGDDAALNSTTVSGSPYTSNNPLAWGAVMDGVTDDSAAWVTAMSKVPAQGGEVGMPAGVSVVASAVAISVPTKIKGQGALKNAGLAGTTVITCPSQTVSPFTVNSDGCSFEDLVVLNTASVAPTAGAGIYFQNGGNMARLKNVAVLKFWNNVQVDRGWAGAITDCMFSDPVNYSVFLRNLDYTDNGDWGIIGCHFDFLSTARTALAHIRVESGGGYRITGNKFNGQLKADGSFPGSGSAAAAIDCAVADGVSTSDLMVAGNSIENWTSWGVIVRQGGTTGSFHNITITGNQISGGASGPYGIWMGAVSDNTKIGNAVVTGNVFDHCNTSIYAQYMQSLTIGVNSHSSGSVQLVQLGIFSNGTSGVPNARVEPQTVDADNVVLIYDSQAFGYSTRNGLLGQARKQAEREIPSCTSSVTYVTLFRLSIPNFAAGQVEVSFNGQITTKGAAMLSTKQTFTKGNGGAVTCTVVGADTTAGFGFDYLLDTASVAGEIQVKVRLNAGVGGTDLIGYCRVAIDGPCHQVKKGA